LAETLQSFRCKQEMPPKPEEPCSYPKGPCLSIPQTTTADAFKAFLRRSAFNGAFADEQIASSFINGVRNGILHEAETRRWIICRSAPKNQIVAKHGEGYVLNRGAFYRVLKADFTESLGDLQNLNSTELRLRFRKKMNDVVRES